jgi:serine/threonine protein phosphatase PrpC
VHELGGSDGANCCLVLACDGIFDVMSDEEAVSVLTLFVLHSGDTNIDIALTLAAI